MRVATVLLMICTAAFCCRAVRAATITFRMTGTIEVSNPDDLLPPEIVTGIPFTAFMTYDLSTPDSMPDDPLVGFYFHPAPTPPNGLLLSTAGHTFENVPSDDFRIEIFNDIEQEVGLLDGDSFFFTTTHVTGPGAVTLRSMGIIWRDPTGTAFDTDMIPMFLDAEAFTNPRIQIFGIADLIVGGSVDSFSINANVEQITVIPEPTGLHISAVALLGFLAFLWLRNRPAQRLVRGSRGGRPSKEGVKR